MRLDTEPVLDGGGARPEAVEEDGAPPADGDESATPWSRPTLLERYGWSFPLMLAAFIALYLVQMHVGMDTSIRAAGLTKGVGVPVFSMRLMSGPLIHANLIHILFNMLFFKDMAIAIHHFFGNWMLFTVFVVSAIAGSFASIVFLPHLASVGASGGILGTVGFMLVFSYRNRATFPPGTYMAYLKTLVFIGVLGILLRSFIDNPAHVGGLVAGCLLGLLLTPAQVESVPVRNGVFVKPLGMVCGVVFAVSVAWTIWAMLA